MRGGAGQKPTTANKDRSDPSRRSFRAARETRRVRATLVVLAALTGIACWNAPAVSDAVRALTGDWRRADAPSSGCSSFAIDRHTGQAMAEPCHRPAASGEMLTAQRANGSLPY
jgi:hypothetical protein